MNTPFWNGVWKLFQNHTNKEIQRDSLDAISLDDSQSLKKFKLRFNDQEKVNFSLRIDKAWFERQAFSYQIIRPYPNIDFMIIDRWQELNQFKYNFILADETHIDGKTELMLTTDEKALLQVL